ncbi:L-histidine N(alpha)-methyltransferase [Aetokthonos hydrillicola Thurmond2011]|jgi:dimethylhistidine N-methyltransferase|uniref:L-histidine N(Alpha)-methyltransferase n=1 Tax=Aetokthonos hydrillicola Thurmond2011 TaxID=2712845 RepID=A0AAP5MAG5_9CYAN|nr:L-histidine N(alpha)-methyltransferase [Aetokthonos hydrillicola]MBO3462998.1 L-histidine N(alpha)-methyltransferase [Aetokthonos hydrillicola CCALA 1050]MBW4587199.1 L-histidine N(alpha)-methyltransferase [Aetokthonos hydrillicola CCALA 1050]MDR9896777.1 L-histidine N(alpha)-methyltransferase [Aetokthonos hydrillicola Thurmond2011]
MVKTSFKFLTEDNQAVKREGADVIQGLTQTPKTLPPKYLYDDRGSELFEEICELPEYYPTRTEASILRQCADEIAEITGSCELVELGSGSSTKTRFLLDAYQRIPGFCKYVPIDVSGGILKSSVLQLQHEYPNLSIEGLIGTYEQALAKLESITVPSRMIFFLGSSIGNFTPTDYNRFLTQISQTLRSGDYFLLGVDLQKPKAILEAAYNDKQEVTAAFNLNMLSHLNWRFRANFDTSLFRHEAIYNQADAQIEMYLHCLKSHWVSLEILDLNVFFEVGESILTEISRKFDLAVLEKQLEFQSLKTLKVWTDQNQWFGLILCQA